MTTTADLDPGLLAQVGTLLVHVLGLQKDECALRAETPLLHHLPQLDSMGVMQLLTALEEQFGIAVDDSDISSATFETLGSLTAYVAAARQA
ncbi:Phosphopantetheine attachment site [Noviherbaspirillum humi]|uniref:Phosphopantetheine attachment site n=2 Tax=Noviherbaspirillum humi TaxID=1688639 RepID=A0A239HKM9_9BURK|nr:Phosphopantetheine attachment site [Noviherbaspirillum humi]